MKGDFLAPNHFYVYMLASQREALYVGVTDDLMRRIWEHKQNRSAGFTTRYKTSKLVYFEVAGNAASANAREKQIKGWRRSKKVDLIEGSNPRSEDLSEEWYE